MGGSRRIGWAALAVALTLVLAGSLWMRLACLGAMNEVNGDEAWYGIAAFHLVHGGHPPGPTLSGNVPDYFYVLMTAPLVASFGPTFWALRLPGMISGVLAVVLAYRLGRRVLDRPSAIVAAGVLAVLPPCVSHATIGCEHTQSPMFGVLALAAAFAARPALLALAFAACFVVHPTNVFLLPLLAPVYLASALTRCPDRRARVRLIAGCAGVVGSVVVGLIAYATIRGIGRIGVLAGERPSDWWRFLRAFARLITGATITEEMGTATADSLRAHEWGVWVAIGAALVLGVPRLLADRRWDRLALIAGLGISLASLHVVAGAAVLGPGTTRYGYVFLAPLAFAFGSLVGPWLTRAGEGSARLRLVTAWPLAAASALLLFDLGANVLEPRARQAGGSLATPWTARGIARRSYDAIAEDLDRAPGEGRRVVVSRSWWVGKPLEYLAQGRRDVRVVSLDDLGPDEAVRRARLGRVLAGGGYLIGFVDQSVAEEARAATNGAALRLWAVEHSGVTFVTLARLARPEDAAAIARGAGSGDRLVR